MEDILDHDYNTMIDILGKEAVQMRPKCATLALGTLLALVVFLVARRGHDEAAASLAVVVAILASPIDPSRPVSAPTISRLACSR